MFTKIVSTVSVLLAVSAHVNGHTLMTPALGVQGAGARSDVQRLAKTGGCGNMDVASNIDTSTPVAAAADGTFTVTATNFNRLTDGSRQLTATMDSTGTGNNFNGAVTVTQNGDNRPKSLGSEQIVAAIPAGTTCSGGASGNLCLVSFQNGARQGFGNCVVVSQGAAAGGATAGTGATAAGTGATAAGAGAATGSTATAAGAGTGASDTSGVGAATGSTATAAGAGTGASDTSGVGAATGSTGAETGTGTGASDTSAVGAATGSTGVEAGAGTGASDNSAVGATTGSTATSGTGVSAGNTAGTGVGAGVNGAASGAGVATSGSNTASTGQALSQAGSRAARALLAELEARGEDSLDLVRRGIVDWIWA